MLDFTTNDLKIVLRDAGEVMRFFSIAMLIPAIIALHYNEGMLAVYSFLGAGAIGLLIGETLRRAFRNAGESRTVHAFTATTTIWFLCPLLGAIPYLLYLKIPVLDAYFESVSYLTTTGLTVLPGALPQSILFWRALEAWIGGAGIVVLALIGIFGFTKSARLSEAEGREERLRPNIIKSVQMIWKIYLFITILGIILLLGTGMPKFSAVNLGMLAISTTGNSGIYAAQEITTYAGTKPILMAITFMGSISFLAHYKYMKGNIGTYFRDTQAKMILFLALLSAIITIPHFAAAGQAGLTEALFSSVNAITNGGFQTVDYNALGPFVMAVTALLMIIGGSTGSTSGGIKVMRLWILLKSAYWKIKEFVLPAKAYFPRKIAGSTIEDQDMNVTFLLVILYLLFIAVGSLTLMNTMNVTGDQAFFEVASAQGNAGLSTGITNQHTPPIAKAMLCINMIVGRLEIIPFLIAGGFILKIRRRQ